MSEWIMTQNGAVLKSEVVLIVSQDNNEGKKNVVLITRDKVALPIYYNIENTYTANILIDNILTMFDKDHVPQIDLQKERERMETEAEKEIKTTKQEEKPKSETKTKSKKKTVKSDDEAE